MLTKNFPKTNSLVIAQVDKIEKFGAYFKLIEYGNIEAFMPIKEVSAGWIKNIHVFLHKGRKMVCRVTDVNEQRQTVDISLKKVTTQESKEKIKGYNLENRISSLTNIAIKRSGSSAQRQTIQNNILSEFGTYANFHAQAIAGQIKNTRIPENFIKTYKEIVESSKKQKKYEVSYTLSFISEDTMSGVEIVKEALLSASEKGVTIHYLGSPKYMLEASGADYPDAEKKAKIAITAIEKSMHGTEITVKKNKTRDEKTDIMETL